MGLEEKIGQDYVQAMKSKDSARSSNLSFLRAQIKNVKIDKRVEAVSDEEVIAIIKKQIKQRQDSIAQFTAGGRNDLASKEQAEMELLKSYLPPEMSPQALGAVIDEVIKVSAAVSFKDMGRVMKEVLAKTAGKADNQTVGALVKERLSKA